MKVIILIFFISMIYSHKVLAKVELSVEPYLGYSQMSLTFSGNEETQLAAVLGGKGGLQLGNLFLGIDFHFGGPYLLEENDNDYTNHMWGLGGAYSGKKIRAFLGYYFTNILEDVERNIKYSGVAYKASIGVTFASVLSVNIEYVIQNYKEYAGNNLYSSQLNDFSATMAFFSISAPLVIK
ncbi:MAG: hypothetical protein KDD58_05760 [Bdellovibrionales bacterium]|nr:hypothetical protein [Bdellovibrionales bacterium]